MKQMHIWLALALSASTALAAEGAGYSNDLSKAEVGKMPEEFLVLDGNFAVAEEGGNKFVELPGAPLETFGFLFGPTEKENIAASARVFTTGKGRRFNTFTVACNGVAGFKLTVAPGKKAVELYKGETLLGTAPIEWKTAKWTQLRVEVKKTADAEWTVRGFVWQEGDTEPKEPTISSVQKEAPSAGRSAVFGMPFAGTPIRFDDLKVTKL
ncbi:MAG TPA: hypothetical protein VEH27_05025 [Methylomirabilota bacterium]|nr:hypothetical protein [Methylomirabilota bacterium]